VWRLAISIRKQETQLTGNIMKSLDLENELSLRRFQNLKVKFIPVRNDAESGAWKFCQRV
jgi:hypothetical protein